MTANIRWIADQLRAERAVAKLSRSELARRSGLSGATVERLERSERTMRIDQLLAICDGLEVKPASFLARAEERRDRRTDTSP
ncbi:XRE family transcriptional regulator [Nocardioides glacieisoli]|uniref:XRE family transcriptional regulator n=1 Tax=Nocardioides glacieisoli TaxID=1168730 RepID=A0A4Q2RQ27_9ACTN|nr:XRE family transcriptional regulator [Nocardioides glacieisoli]